MPLYQILSIVAQHQTVSPTFDCMPSLIFLRLFIKKLNASLSRPQLNNGGDIRHFLGVQGLSKTQLRHYAESRDIFDDIRQLINRPVEGYTVMNLFLSRQRAYNALKSPKSVAICLMCSISILSAPVQRRELVTPLWNLQAMTADIFVVHGIQRQARRIL